MSQHEASPLYAVGIDLGTTYSCLSYLTPQGQPMAGPNAEGEMTTPSVVLFDGDEVIVGTEALRNTVAEPDRVVQHAKRFMGDPQKCWVIDGHVYTPVDISAFILRKLLDGAEERLRAKVRHAVITVPAQFSDYQRQRTIEAGMQAGLERVDIINEPVAAALCYVLGEGMWFAELADDQTVMVFDLGGGTFDLSLVRYNKDRVTVVASGGDLQLGGLDWNAALEQWACRQFVDESPNEDPRLDRTSMQGLAIDVEQAKRALSVRPRATITVQHAGRRKSFGVEREKFEQMTRPLVHRTRTITEQMLRAHKLQIEGREDASSKSTGWAHVNAVLVTGGASRMPMVKQMLQDISGRTLNAALSPDQSISHGAAYYAGMLLSGEKLDRSVLNKQTTARLARFKQQSVNARGLGILVRDKESGRRVPHYLIPPNSPLPVSAKQSFGTVSFNQRRVNLHIIESGANPDDPPIALGDCLVEGLPSDLAENTPIEVTINYDEQARVHVSALEPKSGKAAKTTIVRTENLRTLPREAGVAAEVTALGPPIRTPPAKTPEPPAKNVFRPVAAAPPRKPAANPPASRQIPAPPTPSRPKQAVTPRTSEVLERADKPILLCNACGEPYDARGRCPTCGGQMSQAPPAVKRPGTASSKTKGTTPPSARAVLRRKEDEPQGTERMKTPPKSPPRPKLRKPKPAGEEDTGADEFWNSLG